jgi:Ras-related protein Rab-21
MQVGDAIVLTIVGNKSDLARERTVPEQVSAEFAQSIGAQHVSVSAKTGQGIEAAVFNTAQKVLASRKERGASGRPPGSTGAQRFAQTLMQGADKEMSY